MALQALNPKIGRIFCVMALPPTEKTAATFARHSRKACVPVPGVVRLAASQLNGQRELRRKIPGDRPATRRRAQLRNSRRKQRDSWCD